jgi:transcriptional regulator with XRE-family HTH domain
LQYFNILDYTLVGGKYFRWQEQKEDWQYMSKPNYWWEAYGCFSQGEENYPHVGQVIRYYRKICGMERKELASLLGCTQRYVEMLESDRNLTMPQLISRRKLLTQVLHIPPVLLGLSPFILGKEEVTNLSTSPANEEGTISTRRIAFYEEMLALCWESYYTSSIERATKNIVFSLEILSDEAEKVKGPQQDMLIAMQCRFYRLSALVARENQEIDKAYQQINEAISLATQLQNAELIAASLVGRIRLRYHKQEFEEALQDAEWACSYADAGLLRDPLKGKCYQLAGEAQAYLAGDDRNLQEKSIAYFDKAGRIARKGNLEPDGSFVKTDLTSIYIERAKALRLFRRFDEAHNALAIARKNLSPELTRWRVNLLIEEAKTYFAEGDISSCCSSLIDALPIVRAIHLQNREKPIQSLLEQCRKREPSNQEAKRLEKLFVVG